MFHNLVKWSLREFSHLPWRKNRTLYSTLVSEIMLQQTTVGTVLNYFEKFMLKYPTPQSLATATDEELAISWKGLGYYRRARNLKLACTAIVNDFNGIIPTDLDVLKTIPGIGEYTANAIRSIGANLPSLSVDANLERVLSRVFLFGAEKGPKLQKEIGDAFKQKKILTDIISLGPSALNEAFMDLGRTLCKVKNPQCGQCPLNADCQAYLQNKIALYPRESAVKKEKNAKFFELVLVRVVAKRKNKVLAYKKQKGEWLEGQYEIPTFILSSEDKSLKQYPLLPEQLKTKILEKSLCFKTGITKYSIQNIILNLNDNELDGDFEWVERDEDISNLSTSSIKALNLFEQHHVITS